VFFSIIIIIAYIDIIIILKILQIFMRFSTKNLTKGFTLMELLVVITIIWIMTIWAMNMKFDISDREKLAMFDNEIITQIEQIRDFALIWKWVLDGSNRLVVPDRWDIVLSPSDWGTSKWKIVSRYYLDSSNTNTVYKEYDAKNPFLIETITCKELDNTDNDIANNENVTLIFKWSKISLDTTTNPANCQDEIKEIILSTDILKKVQWKITINKLSWVIQREKK